MKNLKEDGIAILKVLEMFDKNDIVFVSGSESFVVKTNEKLLNIKELVESYDVRSKSEKEYSSFFYR